MLLLRQARWRVAADGGRTHALAQRGLHDTSPCARALPNPLEDELVDRVASSGLGRDDSAHSAQSGLSTGEGLALLVSDIRFDQEISW
jgi:hypothetical protein